MHKYPEDLQMLSLFWTLAVSTAPTAYRMRTFAVKEDLQIKYAEGVLCDAAACTPNNQSACQNPNGPARMSPTPNCPKPSRFDLKLDIYTPVGAISLGPRPVFIATHSGGYGHGTPLGFGPTWEMKAACRYFASRGYVALTMDYRLTNQQTGGGLRPTNWSVSSPLSKAWAGGFRPLPSRIYPAVRDTKAAIRWLRGQPPEALHGYSLADDYFSAGGWSAGACTTAFLASQHEEDMKTEMDQSTDPTFGSLEPYLDMSSRIAAGVVWAGNSVVTDTTIALTNSTRYSKLNAPLALYRGSEDETMTPVTSSSLPCPPRYPVV